MLRGANIVMEVIRMDGDGANVTASVATKVLERLKIQLEMSYPNAPDYNEVKAED